MGYTLKFGTFDVNIDHDAREARTRAVVPNKAELPPFPYDCNYPDGPDMSSSYRGWTDFCRTIGIYDLMFDQMIECHPGVVAYTEEMQARLEAATASYQTVSGMTPERAEQLFKASKKEANAQGIPLWKWSYSGVPKSAWTVIHARWLTFWGRWCLDNCEHPTFENW